MKMGKREMLPVPRPEETILINPGRDLSTKNEKTKFIVENDKKTIFYHSKICSDCGKPESCNCELNQNHKGVCKKCLIGEDKIKEMEIKPHGEHFKICIKCGKIQPCEGTCNFLVDHSTTCDSCINISVNEKYL